MQACHPRHTLKYATYATHASTSPTHKTRPTPYTLARHPRKHDNHATHATRHPRNHATNARIARYFSGLELEESYYVLILANCLRSLEQQLKEIFDLSKMPRESQIKGELALQEVNKAI